MTGRAAILSIGAGRNQLPLLRAARATGLAVVAVDRAPSPEALPLLDHALTLSTYDVEAVTAALPALAGRFSVAGVVARTSGPAIMTAALAAAALGIEGVPLALAEAAVRKSQARLQAAALDIAVPHAWQGAAVPALDPGRAWVLKPDVPVFGKRNVFLVGPGEGMAEAFAAAAAESVDGTVEVQEYVPGLDVGLGVLVAHGMVLWSFLYDELVTVRDGRFTGLGVAGPSVVDGSAAARSIRLAARHLLEQWGVQHGFVFFSFRVDDDGNALLYEVNPGLGGDALADGLVPALWPHFDPFVTDVHASIGGMVMPPGEPSGTCAVHADGALRGTGAAVRLADLAGDGELAERLRRWESEQ